MDMVIWVIGVGGVGGWIAHQLASAGESIHLLVRAGSEAKWRESGLRLITEEGPKAALNLNVASDPTELPTPELVIVAVKTPDLAGVLQKVEPHLPKGTPLLLFQNGLGAGELAQAMVPQCRSFHAPVFLQGWTSGRGEVTALRPRRLVLPDDEPLDELFRRAGFEVEGVADLALALWRKAAFLVPFAAIDLDVEGGASAILEDPRYAELIKELCLFSAVEGHPLPESTLDEILAFTATLTPDAHSSLYRDIHQGREGEWEDLIGWCQRRARSRFLDLPVLQSLKKPVPAKA
jgi:2-dehydropantoate 2-reductase